MIINTKVKNGHIHTLLFNNEYIGSIYENNISYTVISRAKTKNEKIAFNSFLKQFNVPKVKIPFCTMVTVYKGKFDIQ